MMFITLPSQKVTLKTTLISAGYITNSLRVEDEWRFRVEAEKGSDWSALASVHISQQEFIMEAFQSALWREPDPMGRCWADEQFSRKRPRKEVLKHLYSSEEQLFKVAEKHGL